MDGNEILGSSASAVTRSLWRAACRVVVGVCDVVLHQPDTRPPRKYASLYYLIRLPRVGLLL